jgi:uncharacterized protein
VHEMRVMAIGVEPGAYRPVLLLEEAGGDHRLLPVWIGAAEANAITVEQRGISGPRPITHQLIGHILAAFGRRLEQVLITEAATTSSSRVDPRPGHSGVGPGQ